MFLETLQEVPSSCPTRIWGFVFLPALDFDTTYQGLPYIQYGDINERSDVAAMAEACLRIPECVAFTGWTYLYTSVPQDLRVNRFTMFQVNGRCTGLYVRASAITRGVAGAGSWGR